MIVAGPLVACARKALRLTAPACAKFWTLSNPVAPPAWDGRFVCHGCPAGAARAGVALDPMQALRDSLASICPRCRCTCTRIINRRLCVSCYNRDREVRCGRNRKGQPPRRVASRLFACRLVAVEAGVPRQIETELASGAFELVLARTRGAPAPVAFGWAPLVAIAP
jgi:hypothetical protein